ncbi:vitamin B6 photo-protection and homoeostasis-domain-containing protein [Dissophora ornata]|nr:hypothetical protein BGZ58_002668 [Dissophora ornata]KAI8606653.1 vitamin B6 photo-protection and homoeostasis-domain-containing protein [Dissophora ornata]
MLHSIRSSGHPSKWSSRLYSSSLTTLTTSRSYPVARTGFLISKWTARILLPAESRFLSTGPPSSNNSNGHSDSNNSNPTANSINVRQRKNGTWLPKWHALTLSKDQRSTTSTFQASANGELSPKVESVEEEPIGAAKYLLSPQTALAVFLPKGFPESVTPNYWKFAKWQFIHNVAGSVTSVISTQSLLFAMGLGAGSIPMAAALNWIIKDGLGQLGGVVYASFVSDKFDSEPKRFRFQATVAMQGANVLELLTPLWPSYFLVIASISNIGKNMAWLASSATRAQMNKTFALRDNLGDITGKSGSQTTAAGLVGTGLGVVIAALMSHVSQDPTVLPLVPMCLTFLPFAVFNIYANYRASYYVTTSSLNVPRTEAVFYSVLKELVLEHQNYSKEKPSVAHLQQQLERLVSVPMEIAHEEVFVTAYQSPFHVGIDIEPSITRFTGRGDEIEALDRALRQADFLKKERYYIMVDESIKGSRKAGPCNGKVVIWFDKSAKGSDLIQGFYHACAARTILEHGSKLHTSTESKMAGAEDTPHEESEWNRAVRMAHKEAIETVPTLVEVMDQKGWDTSSLFLTDGEHNRIQLG